MTRQTSLHGWTVPTEGDTDYENTFDDFFVDLDTNGELRDLESNLQNYTPKEGAKFVATDTENEFIGNGTTWNQLQTSGKNPEFTVANTNVTKHATDISQDYTVDSGEGAVFAGPLTGTGSVSGNGRVSVIQEGHQFTDDVDAQGNDISNVGSLSTESANITQINTNRSTQTISSGAIDYSGSYIQVKPESGSSDTLDTINNAQTGLLIIQSDSNTITVEDATANIRLDGNTNLGLAANELLTLVCDGSTFYEISRSKP
jgi:hypothetical protein